MTEKVETLKQENASLRDELRVLRQKHEYTVM